MLQDYAAIFKDAEGDLEDELDRDLADETVHSLLLSLCLAGLFNGTEPVTVCRAGRKFMATYFVTLHTGPICVPWLVLDINWYPELK